MRIQFEVPGKPQGKARQRSFIKRDGHIGSYTPKEQKNYETWIRLAYIEETSEMAPSDAPVSVEIMAYFDIPASTSKKMRERMLEGQEWPTKKPDADNIIKSVLDGLNHIAYHDDKQVTVVVCQKMYDERPRLEVAVEW